MAELAVRADGHAARLADPCNPVADHVCYRASCGLAGLHEFYFGHISHRRAAYSPFCFSRRILFACVVLRSVVFSCVANRRGGFKITGPLQKMKRSTAGMNRFRFIARWLLTGVGTIATLL